MRWAGRVARMEDGRGAYRVLVGRPYLSDHLENLDLAGRTILKWIFKGGMDWIDLAQDRNR